MNDYIFDPLTSETLGPWCEDAEDSVKDIGSRLFKITEEKINFL